MRVIFLIATLILFLCSPSYATEWCFTEPQAQDLCVFMEKCDNCNKQIQTCLEANNELEQENVLLKQNNKLSTENYELEKMINKELRERIVLMDKQCDKRVEDAKPKFFQKLGWFGSGTLTGILLTIMGILAL